MDVEDLTGRWWPAQPTGSDGRRPNSSRVAARTWGLWFLYYAKRLAPLGLAWLAARVVEREVRRIARGG